MRAHLAGLSLALAAVVGCGGSSTAPSPAGPLRLTVAPLQTLVGSPSSAQFSIRLENVSMQTVALDFPSSCQLMPYVFSRSTGRMVLPTGGGWGCATVITSLTLGAGESHVQTVTFMVPGPAIDPLFPVPPGDYTMYARLEDTKYKLQSESVSFSLK
jgi:hypothetical protein